ncbi:uncharacterized protein JCM10292_007751 [Rhodotorula paludigena]|uniref:uncharacterized protein n=1 Tax=Rhodotorula paludigena TaxID=86838 RepID=UPI003179F381
MTPTSPTLTSTSTGPPRPPARNKSSSNLSTHTLRSLSSTSTGKPRRNKSSTSLSSHHHSAGHHPVSFAHHRRASHGPHQMRRSGSATGTSRKSAFGLGMTSMPGGDDADGHEGGPHGGGDDHGVVDQDGEQRQQRPDLGRRRTSSSSTATVVASERGAPSSERGRSRSRSRARQEEENRAAAERELEHERQLRIETDDKGKGKARVSGSVTSTSDWESATDSPLAIGKKLPDVSQSFRPEDHSGLAQAFDERPSSALDDDETDSPQPQQIAAEAAARANGGQHERRPKFQVGASEEQEEPERPADVAAQDLLEDHVPPPQEGTIPSAAMPPAATPALPSLPAVIQAVTPAQTDSDAMKPSPDAEQEAAGFAAPAPPSAPQHLSPPESSPIDEHPSAEPSLAAAAQPEFAFSSRPPSSGPTTRAPSPTDRPRTPQHPTPTDVAPTSPPPPQPTRVHPTRKSSNASIMSGASVRSHLHRPMPNFRRSASGMAPTVLDRGATARAQLTSPGPESQDARSNEAMRRSVIGERPGSSGGHRRTESMSSMQSLRQAAEATAGPARRAQTLGPADAQRLRPGETAGGALAALQAAASRAQTPSGSAPEGALSHAKRSASGYFNALRGFTGLPSTGSTPPLSPSATASQRYPIPGAPQPSSSYGRSSRARSSPSPRQPPLIVKFVEPPPPSAPTPPPQPTEDSSASASPYSSSPRPNRPLTAQHRTASSASLGPMSRTQQKALLARDAPQATPTSGGVGAALAPPPVQGVPSGLTPAQQQFLLLQQQRAAADAAAKGGAAPDGGSSGTASGSASPSPAAAAAAAAAASNGMQKWAFGLVREAERIERQYRAVEKWRDPLGESLERVLIVKQRAKRRREDDRERVKAAIAAQQAKAQAQAQLQAKTGASTPKQARASAGSAQVAKPDQRVTGNA